jgi:hypothetical protein
MVEGATRGKQSRAVHLNSLWIKPTALSSVSGSMSNYAVSKQRYKTRLFLSVFSIAFIGTVYNT